MTGDDAKYTRLGGWYPLAMQAVPLSFFLFLMELAAGGLIVSALLDWQGDVSAGYLLLNEALLFLFALGGIWLRLSLPVAVLLRYPPGRPWFDLEMPLWILFAVLTAIHLWCLRSERRAPGRWVVAGAAMAGAAGIVSSAGAYARPELGVAPLLGSLATGALALGTSWSGMMLGHWYLVTPRLAPRPLLRLDAGMAGTLVIQAALVAWLFTTLALQPSLNWLFWLRGGVGIAFPLVLALPIWITARARSMMSATGLLYIALAAVLVGEIMSKALYFISGVPV